MDLCIEHWDKDKDGELSADNMRKKLKNQGYNCTQYTFPPGTTFPDHTHDVNKKDAIVSGLFKFTMYGKEVVLKPGDTIEVPRNTVHNAEVVGTENVLFFDSTK